MGHGTRHGVLSHASRISESTARDTKALIGCHKPQMGVARIQNPVDHPLSLWGTNEAYSWFYHMLLYRYNVKDKNVVYHISWCCCLAMPHSNHSLQFHCCTWYTAQLLPILTIWEWVMTNDIKSGCCGVWPFLLVALYQWQEASHANVARGWWWHAPGGMHTKTYHDFYTH